MKVKLENALHLYDAVNSLYEKDLDGGVLHRLYDFRTDLEKESKFAEGERNKLINKYAPKDKDGNVVSANGTINVAPENMGKFYEEWDKILSLDCDIKKLDMTVKELDGLGSMKGAYYNVLRDIIERGKK